MNNKSLYTVLEINADKSTLENCTLHITFRTAIPNRNTGLVDWILIKCVLPGVEYLYFRGAFHHIM